MSSLHTIQNFIKADGLQKASMAVLKPGQLLYGRIEKFLTNDTAIVQIGSMKLLAQLKTSLFTAGNYIFDVQSNDNNGIELKVLVEQGGQPSGILEQLQLPNTTKNAQLLQLFIENNIPFTKEQIKTAATWLPTQPDANEITALEWMAKRDLPFTKPIFQSLVAVQDSQSFSSQLVELASLLEDPKFASYQTIQPLKQMIGAILQNNSIDQLNTGSEVKQMLQTIVRSLGLEYEKEIGLWTKDKQNLSATLHSLKPLLISALAELGNGGREMEKLLNRLTGMQLISQDPTGPIQQMVVQLPVSFGNKRSDVTMQWSGKKTSSGQIEPDYCRILFYLDLVHIQQTIIDMQIQNKIIHLSVINDKKEIEPIIQSLTPILKQKLEGLGYQLSFIKVNPPDKKVTKDQLHFNPAIFSNQAYQGVDIKI